MGMDRIGFTPREERTLRRSGNAGAVLRRRRAVIAVSVLFLLLFAGLGLATRSWVILMVCAMLFVVITLVEKLTFINAELVCKSVIVKLAKRIQELNYKKD